MTKLTAEPDFTAGVSAHGRVSGQEKSSQLQLLRLRAISCLPTARSKLSVNSLIVFFKLIKYILWVCDQDHTQNLVISMIVLSLSYTCMRVHTYLNMKTYLSVIRI